jgi:WD40 repeat protein
MDHAAGQIVLPSGASAAGEFVAHNATVTCLSIGPKTGRLLATASEDRKVNLWPISKSNCLVVSGCWGLSFFLISLLLPDETLHMLTHIIRMMCLCEHQIAIVFESTPASPHVSVTFAAGDSPPLLQMGI